MEIQFKLVEGIIYISLHLQIFWTCANMWNMWTYILHEPLKRIPLATPHATKWQKYDTHTKWVSYQLATIMYDTDMTLKSNLCYQSLQLALNYLFCNIPIN